jgi:hypothetical protein
VSCDVELVADLSAVEPEHVDAPEPEPVLIQFAEVCGFLDLDEARRARDQLHQSKIVSDLLIRSSPETPEGGRVVEEYWLRADARQMRQVKALLEGSPPAPAPAPAAETPADGFKCSNCQRPVREEESFCANCGMRFSE